MISFKELKGMVRIEIKTGNAIIPEREYRAPETRPLDVERWEDYQAVRDLYRRLVVVESMNNIIRLANNEDIACGRWLMVGVADGDKGLDLYNYVYDEAFYDLSETFIEIMKDDVKKVQDLIY